MAWRQTNAKAEPSWILDFRSWFTFYNALCGRDGWLAGWLVCLIFNRPFWRRHTSLCEGENEWTAIVACYYEGPKIESSPGNPGVKYSLQGYVVASPEIAWVSGSSQIIHYSAVTLWNGFFFCQFSITTHPFWVLGGKTVFCSLGRRGPVESHANVETVLAHHVQ